MHVAKDTSLTFVDKITASIKSKLHALRTACKNFKTHILTNFACWSDPKLEPYRVQSQKNPTSKKNYQNTLQSQSNNHNAAAREPESTKKTDHHPTPQTINEFLDLMRRTPRNVINQRERHVIATIINFPNTKVSELMLPQSAITYVRDDEVLGPLTLDRLYHSGFQHFPVIDKNHKIIGIIHTTALNSLEIREASLARQILDPKIYYIREDYTLNQALAAFLRTNCYFFLVIDRFERVVGIITYQMLVDHLLGETPADDFDRDDDRLAVAKRKI